MIRVVIQAGFGNQLFQYATAYALARELGQPLEVDTSFFSWYNKNHPATARQSAMDLLKLDAHTTRTSSNSKYWIYRPWFSLPFRYFPFYVGGQPMVVENIPNCRQDQRALFSKIGKRGATLFGFWQNTVYFDKYLLDLKRQFQPNYELDSSVSKLYAEVADCESVGVHIRRGDFVGLGWDKGADYYLKGMAWVKEKKPDVRFFIVTDDKKWVCEQFYGRDDITIIDIKTPTCDIDEFFLLSSCKHQVISESTFGWWAAFLNTNKDKLIVIPQTAVGQIFSDEWHKI